VQEEAAAGEQARALIDGVLAAGAQAIAMRPNSDAGGGRIRATFDASESADLRVLTHLPRPEFLSWMARADALVGNSSAGIIEAASLGQWVVNVGTRQRLRERSGNVIDVAPDASSIRAVVADVVARPRRRWQNVYGDGNAAPRIVELLARLSLAPELLNKTNAY
jgi:GDP/UDP-N,N'-diacetylbacillosamine 2-epimerase (hydrolysing)